MTAANSNIAITNAVYCEQLVRELDRDRWLSCLFVHTDHRPALLALYAFNAEIVRIRDLVSEPLPGEVRLQWWRDLMGGIARGDSSGNPVAAELLAAIKRYSLPRAALAALIDAHTHDLYDDLLPTTVDLEGYCGETSSALYRLSSLILADGDDAGSADLAGHAGVAYGIVNLMRMAARHASRGQIFIPADILALHDTARDDILNGRNSAQLRAALFELAELSRNHLSKAMALLPAAPSVIGPAYLPLALVEPLLHRMTKPSFDLFKDRPEPAQWLRQWYLWRFTRRLP